MNVRPFLVLLLGVLGCQHTAPDRVPVVVVPPEKQTGNDAVPKPACATLPENLAHFRVTEVRENGDGDEDLTLMRLDPENPVETYASNAATVVGKGVVTSDGVVGYVLRFGETSGDGIVYDCGSLATCVHGFYVECKADVLVEMIPADYRSVLELAPESSRYEGQSWHDILEIDRRASHMAEDPEYATERRWTRGESGYVAGEWSE